jgi:membrane associated rhomboid family serine protease
MSSLPPVTQALILINAAVFLAQLVLGGVAMESVALWPFGSGFMPWQVVSYAFVHANLLHLLFNMWGVFMFGSDLERTWGPRRYLSYYLTCAVSAAAAQLLVAGLTAARYPTVGASGALFGLLLAYAMVFPTRTIMPLFPPIPMRAPVFVAVFGALELVLGVTGTQAGVAHFAHLSGLAGGFLFMRGRH